jgi:translocation and assembly module TamB
MSEPEIDPTIKSGSGSPRAERRSWRSRMRRFFLRHVPLTAAGAFVLIILISVAAYFVASSSAFENAVRKRLIAEIETATGGRAEIASFHWRLLHLQAEADGIVIHGLEDPGEAPYAEIDRLRAQLSILDIFTPRILLRDLDISRPQVHLIVYPDGSTNQPHPLRRARPGEPVLDKLFDLQAGHMAVDGGVLHYDCRAAAFDFQNRYAPLDFEADDVSLVMRYIPQSSHAPEFYRIEAQANRLNLARNVPRIVPGNVARKQPLPVEGNFKAAVDLERSRIVLRGFDLVAHPRGDESHTLHIAGELDDFNHPHWQANVSGDLDMRLLDPVFGYPDAPEGIAHLSLAATGAGPSFHIDGPIHIDKGSYIGAGINARGVTLDTQIHADQKRLQINSVVARLAEGGQLEGAVDLQPWLPSAPPATVERSYANPQERRAGRNTLVRSAPPTIPVNGKVTAGFKNVSLDTLLDIVAAPPYRRLGLDALVNGPALATWSYGQAANVSVTARLALSPSQHSPRGEAPTSGIIDGTYTQRNGGVDLRSLELHLPSSDLQARGALGAYPVTRPSSLSIDLRSTNLAEFDSALRSLGLNRNGRTGTAALPVALSGQAEFHGAWTGSLIKPQIAGSLKATQLGVEIPGQETSAQAAASGQPRMLHMDSVQVDGSYSPAQIAIRHADLVRGKSRITLSGTLDATTVPKSSYAAPKQAFDADSVLHLRAEGTAVDFADVQPFLGTNSSSFVTGEFNTQIDLNGPLHSPEGSGWLDMDHATIYSEPVTRVSLHGLVKDHVLTLTSATLEDAGGVVTASGSYAFADKRFNVDAHAERIEIAQIGWLHQRNLDVKGKLGITVTGSGTLEDPHLDFSATVTALTLGGQRFGALDVSAHSANRALNYTLNTQFQGAAFSLRGATQLSAGYDTHAQLDFSSFNIDALFAMAHLEAFRGQSALAGTVTVAGPLARPRELTGEVRLNELAMTIAGVPLKSEGGAHATLAAGRVQLDPLHITGADTDLHLQGSLSLEGARQLDLSSSGSVNLKLAETLDSDLTARGTTTFKIDARGPLMHPDLEGHVELQDGSLSLGDLPNGLSQLRGSLEFNQDRLEVQSLTAMSGGGQLSVSGYLAYQRGIYADLSVTGKGVRIRYPQGVTSLADAKFQLQGAQNNLLLSGDVLITRFTANPDLDLAALAAQAGPSVQTIAPPDAPSNHVRLDVHIASSPQLNFQNAFAKLAGDVDVNLRGTLASPSLLGRVDITQGSAMIAGTRYDLERGEITFTNPLRIEPTIDLSATARVEDYDITLGLNGPPQKLAVTYRSDPPLPEADVVSLLALGHTANQQRLYTQQQQQAISNPTDALLGGALNATVSSRIQKLFGAGSVKLDPDYLGAFGNSTSRITVQEQLGRDITLTYATDVNTTSQQLLQAEVAINRHVSLVVARDESGVFSLVIKATRRYR